MRSFPLCDLHQEVSNYHDNETLVKKITENQATIAQSGLDQRGCGHCQMVLAWLLTERY
jgi:hypothetical protein